jgi:hypothetical protein
VLSQVGSVLQRIGGSGWIVLMSQIPTLNEEYPELANYLLQYTDISRSPVMISSSDSHDPSVVGVARDLEMLIGVETVHLSLATARQVQSAEVGLFLLSGEDVERWIEALTQSNLGAALKDSLLDGSLIFAVDGAASALGSWAMVAGKDEPQRGSDWLPGAMILPRLLDPAESEAVRSWLTMHERVYALGLAGGGIVAFGPEGEFQLWGGDNPTVLLGSGW